MTRHRTTLRGLMIAVAVCAAGLVVVRAEPDPALGFLMVAGSIAGLAAWRTVLGVRHHRSLGRPLTPRRMAGILIGSTTVALTIILVSDLCFLFVQSVFSARYYHRVWSPQPEEIVCGMVCAVLVARRLRKLLWHQGSRRERVLRWRLGLGFAPAIVLVSILVGSVPIRRSYELHRAEAERYRAILKTVPATSKDAAIIGWLAAWHDRAAFRPWFPSRPKGYPSDLR